MIDTKEMVRSDGVGRADLEARLRAAAKEIDHLRDADTHRVDLVERLHAAIGDYCQGGEHYADGAARLLRERDQLEDQIGHVQTECTQLLDQVRACRRIADAPPGELLALSHVSHERRLQDARWGPIEKLLDVPMGSLVMCGTTLGVVRQFAQAHCDETGRETCCWAHLVLEEAYELVSEPDSEPKRIRAEAVQLAALCVKLIEILDRRANVNPLPVTAGIPLPGWQCMATRTVTDGEVTRVETCRAFNGASKEWLKACRACGAAAPEEAM